MLWIWLLTSALAPQAELVVHYPFDGSNEDIVSGEDAFFDGTVTYGFGPIGDCAALAPSAVIDVGPVTPLGSYSVAFFALWTGEPGQVYACDAVRSPQLFVAVDTQMRLGGRLRLVEGGRWNHIALTWDGTHQVTYINGVADDPLPDALDASPVVDGACVLGDPNSRSELALFVDDFRVYEGVLGGSEVDALVVSWDTDGDGIGDVNDNCPDDDNPDQLDRDVDGLGDLCDPTPDPPDTDGDGVVDPLDRCEGDDAVGDSDNDGWCADTDCDDRNASVHPRAQELCDGVDTDCDGDMPDDEEDWDDDGWSECEGDCNEGDRFINPGEEEQCDGVDNDCAGGVDPLFCGVDCAPTGCLCTVAPGPIVGWWTLMLLVFANRRRRSE